MARDKLKPTRVPKLYRRVADGLLVVRVTMVDPRTGKRLDRRTLGPDATMNDARTAAHELRNALLRPLQPDPPKVADYCELWLRRQLARGRWTADGSNTPRIVASALDLHLLPQFGDWRVDTIRMTDLETWTDHQCTIASPNTVRTRWQWASAVLSSAAAEHGFPGPTGSVQPPRGQYRTAPDLVLEPVDLARFIAHIEAKYPNWLPLVVLGFDSGARPGELVACKLSDLELDREVGRWTIAGHVGDRWHLVPGAKGKPEGRLIYLDPASTERLRELTALAFRAAWLTPAELVHSRRTRAEWPSPDVLGHMLKAAGREALDRHTTGKVFRQTHNTLSQLAGVHSAVTREQIGHTSARMTQVYTRIPNDAREAAARTLGQLISSSDSL